MKSLLIAFTLTAAQIVFSQTFKEVAIKHQEATGYTSDKKHSNFLINRTPIELSKIDRKSSIEAEFLAKEGMISSDKELALYKKTLTPDCGLYMTHKTDTVNPKEEVIINPEARFSSDGWQFGPDMRPVSGPSKSVVEMKSFGTYYSREYKIVRAKPNLGVVLVGEVVLLCKGEGKIEAATAEMAKTFGVRQSELELLKFPNGKNAAPVKHHVEKKSDRSLASEKKKAP